MLKKLVAASAALALSLSALAPPAQAWTLYKSFENVRNGFQSKRWWDGSPGTTWMHTSHCRNNAGKQQLGIELKLDVPFRPDRSFDTRDAHGCFTGTADNAWEVVRGDHYFTVRDLFDWQTVSADNIILDF